MAYAEIGEYRLGKLARGSRGFPHGQWCAVWGGKADRRRYGLGVCAKREESVALASLADFVRRRTAASVAVSERPLGEIVEAYIADRRNAGRKIKSAEANWKALSEVFGHMRPEGVEAPMVVQGKTLTACHHYAVLRSEAGRSRDTIWTELLFMRTVINWAVENKLIEKTEDGPPKVWVPSKGAPRNVLITEDEAWRLIDGCVMPHLRLFTIIALCATARKGAILELTWDRVDFERGVVDFNTHEERGILDSGYQKGRSIVPMNNLLRAALSEAKTGARSKYVVEWNGSKVGDIKKGFSAALKRAGLEDRRISPHVLRHVAASWMASADIPMRQIQKLLGHSSEKITEAVYASKTGHSYLSGATNVIDLKLNRKTG
jgi:integrase